VSFWSKIGDGVDLTIQAVARHGKTECPDCGSFNKRGHGCRCFEKKEKWSDKLSTEDIQELLKLAYELTIRKD